MWSLLYAVHPLYEFVTAFFGRSRYSHSFQTVTTLAALVMLLEKEKTATCRRHYIGFSRLGLCEQVVGKMYQYLPETLALFVHTEQVKLASIPTNFKDADKCIRTDSIAHSG